MQASNPSDNFQQQVLSELRQISQKLGGLETDVEELDFKFDTYQTASDVSDRL